MIRAISWQSSVFWRWCPGPDSVTFDEMVRSLGGSVSAGAHVLRVRAAISGVFLTGTVTTGVLLTSCFGGQSGGETGELSPAAPDSPAACACVAEGTRPVRAQVTRLEAGCAELEVLEVLEAPFDNEYGALEVGDVFGGTLRLACSGSESIEQGDEVLAQFIRGAQSTSECREYRACSTERCGDPSDAYGTTSDPECIARREEDPSVDCAPIEVVDQAALEVYDRCDTACLEETRDVCMSHLGQEQLGGTVVVTRWQSENISFYWAGEERSASFEELRAPECPSEMNALWQTYYQARSRTSSGGAAEAPPDELTTTPAPECPVQGNP